MTPLRKISGAWLNLDFEKYVIPNKRNPKAYGLAGKKKSVPSPAAFHLLPLVPCQIDGFDVN